MSTSTGRSRQPEVRTRHRIAILIALEAASLAIMSALHLTGTLSHGARSFSRSDAGIAEAVICVALIAGVTALALEPMRGHRIATATVGFAILGFIVGLSFTIQGGGAIDIAYHATVLPVLVGTLVALLRRPVSQPGGAARTATAGAAENAA